MAPRYVLQLMQMMISLVRSLFANKADLAMENLALRQQLAVFKRKQPRPRLTDLDRAFWTVLKDQFAAWADALVIVKPETVVRWQKKRFRKHWAKKSARPPGRPRIDRQHIAFIKRISGDHPEYGEDRIALELEIKFGIKHSAATIRKYMVKPARPHRPSQSWRTFLKNQAEAIWMCDFCVQHTVKFTALYIFVVMELGSRKVVHINVTEHPTLACVHPRTSGSRIDGLGPVTWGLGNCLKKNDFPPASRLTPHACPNRNGVYGRALAWVKQQLRDATFDGEPKFLIHATDGIFGQLGKPVAVDFNGKKVSCRSSLDLWLAETMGIRGIPTPYHAPNAQAHVERFIGTLRRELLDRILVWNEGQLRTVLAEYIHGWYNNSRVHQGIHGIPDPDPELAGEKPAHAKLVARPILNGLHHDYRAVA